MQRKKTTLILFVLMVTMAFFVMTSQTSGTEYVIKKVKVIPVPWQKWRMQVNGVSDIIFFDPPQPPDDAVAIVRDYAVLKYEIPLDNLTWEGTMNLLWEPVDDPKRPYILGLNEEVELFIPTTESDRAVLVRYSVAWASTSDVIEAHFVNEAILVSKSPQTIVGWLSNFDVHNDYKEPIDNFELEFYGKITPGDVLYVYDPPGPPYLYLGWLGPTWYGGWGAPPQISSIPGGIEITWIDQDHPVKTCEWIHFGVALNPNTVFLTGAKAYLTQKVIKADVDIKPGSDPNTINLKSKGKWITVTIELAEFPCNEIDASTVLWDGTLSPVLDPRYGWAKSEDSYCVDENGNGVLERLLKFDLSDIEDLYGPGDYTVTFTGKLFDGTAFEGSDTIRVIKPGK